MSSEPTSSRVHASAEWRRRLKNEAFRGLSRAVRTLTRGTVETDRIERILVLQLQQLGDTVIFTPALRAIRERYPAAQLDMLVNSVSYEFYKKCPYVDRFYVDRGPQGSQWRLRQILPLVHEIRRVGYDLAVADVTQVAARYSAICFLTGARMRVGFEADDRGFLYTTRIHRKPGANFIDCNLDLARALGADPTSTSVECFYDASDESIARQLLGTDMSDRPIVVVHPASNWQSKTWLGERWAKVCDDLVDRHGASIAFVGSARERAEIEAIASQMKGPAKVLAGETDLAQLAAVIATADLFIGTDSGPRHVASGTGKPQVTLMSSLDLPERWQFSRATEVVLRTDPACSGCLLSYCSHRKCMVEISESMVVNACSQLLARHFRYSSQHAR
jgi:ADP-heptose:LPS heptosyltransferase